MIKEKIKIDPMPGCNFFIFIKVSQEVIRNLSGIVPVFRNRNKEDDFRF